MQTVYNPRLFRILLTTFQESVKKENDAQYSLQLTLMIICIIVVVAFFLVLHLPVLNQVSSEVERIRNMVTMIPIDLIQQIKSIRELFNGYLLEIYRDT